MAVVLKGITWDHPRGYDSIVGACAARSSEGSPGATWSRRSLQAFADASLADLAAEFELMVIDHPHIPSAAASGVLLTLDGRGFDHRLDELRAQSVGPSHATYAHGGHQYALAIDAAAQVAAYRPDLLPEPPRSWAEVEAFARTGRMLWPAKPIDVLSSFLSVAANQGTPCAAGRDAWIERGAGLEVLARLHRLADAVPPFCLEANPIEIAERLTGSDDWAYAPLLFGYVNYSRPGFRRRRLAYIDMPAGPFGPSGSCLGGAGIAVSARSPHAQDALELAFWLASAATQKGPYYAHGGQPANRMAWLDPALNADSLAFFESTLRTLDMAWVRPRLDNWLTIQDGAGELVHAALRRELDDQTCLDRLDDLYRRHMDAEARA